MSIEKLKLYRKCYNCCDPEQDEMYKDSIIEELCDIVEIQQQEINELENKIDDLKASISDIQYRVGIDT